MTPSTDVVTTLLGPDTRVGFCCCYCLFVCLIDFDAQVFFSGRMTARQCSYSEAAHIDTFYSEVGWPPRSWVEDSRGRGGARVVCGDRTINYCRDTSNLVLILKDFSHVSPRNGNANPSVIRTTIYYGRPALDRGALGTIFQSGWESIPYTVSRSGAPEPG